MTYVYILSTHDEYGAEDVTATLDRSKVTELVDHYSNNLDYVNEVKKNINKLLERSDIDLSTREHKEICAVTGKEYTLYQDGHPCEYGWGGIKLHVVELK